MTAKERQAAYKARQREAGLRQVLLWLTPDEQYYLERTLMSMREHQAKPCSLRDAKGRFVHLDA